MKINQPAHSVSRPILGNGSFLLAYQLKGKHVLVIGGGREAAIRTFFALDASANVTVVAPPENRHPAVEQRINSGLVRVLDRKFQEEDLELRWNDSTEGHAVDMVLCTIDDHQESRKIALLARAKRIPVNCADIPELCDFYFMAQYRNEELQIAVSTNGGGPRLGARIRNAIVENMNPATPKAVSAVAKIRSGIREISSGKSSEEIKKRMGWVSRFCDTWSIEQLASANDSDKIEKILREFESGRDVPSPPVVNTKVARLNTNLPVFLTSYWWCPSSMGYFAWIQTVFSYSYMIVMQLIYLFYIHFKLLFVIKGNLGERKNVKIKEQEDKRTVDTFESGTPKKVKVGESSKTSSIEVGRNISSTGTETLPEINVDRSTSPIKKELNTQGTFTLVSTNEQASNSETINTLDKQTSPVGRHSKGISTEMVDKDVGTLPPTPIEKSTLTDQIAPCISIDQSTSPGAEQLMDEAPIPGFDNFLSTRYFAQPGMIYLVGAGPGRPELLTIEALMLIKTADYVVSDRLIPQEVLDVIDAEKLELSSFKVGGASDKAQDESNQKCLDALKEGKSVVRLKTGDPFVYGRGGEEILYFREHGFVAKPISASNIPVTHRGVADQVLILTGRGQKGAFPSIPEFVETRTTIFLMALARIQPLIELLYVQGYPEHLPCAIIEKGAWVVGQKVCKGTLSTINELQIAQGIDNPAMFVVGNAVVALD
ncbi:hypothetical protein HK103_001298 [Boothiomyces macroporosus]|uniref:precorrin-2 dehydrogenase n=1 Tax=Boothiomyces macroporosus TaxID=261099 RepID=A0AAD5UE44_9FUNG|nr:hypothetical protein HK103_001298 [Boothiomyces macroporosus]